MKDEIYNRFKKELSELHRKGYSMNYPNSEEFEDKETGLEGFFYQLGFERSKSPKQKQNVQKYKCQICGDTGGAKPTLSEPDGVICECAKQFKWTGTQKKTQEKREEQMK